ncbi:unnamed protein product [Laminaria digitata]
MGGGDKTQGKRTLAKRQRGGGGSKRKDMVVACVLVVSALLRRLLFALGSVGCVFVGYAVLFTFAMLRRAAVLVRRWGGVAKHRAACKECSAVQCEAWKG